MAGVFLTTGGATEIFFGADWTTPVFLTDTEGVVADVGLPIGQIGSAEDDFLVTTGAAAEILEGGLFAGFEALFDGLC